MGLNFDSSRTELIRHLTQSLETEDVRCETLSSTLRGNVLWSLIRITAKRSGAIRLAAGESATYISCSLLERHEGQWKYEVMEESDHLCYYSCPLNYLGRSRVQSPKWRERVQAYRVPLCAIHRAPTFSSTAAFA